MNIFMAVCTEGSITTAAERLFISQPSVSLAIKEMEEYCQMKLFHRSHRKLLLTTEGHKLYDYIANILSQIDEMNLAISKMSTGSYLYIGSGLAAGNSFVPTLIYKFTQKFPHIDTRVSVFSAEVLERYITNQSLDIAIVEDRDNAYNLDCIPLSVSPLVAICDSNNPIGMQKNVTLEELSCQKLLLRENSSHTRNAINNLFAKNKLPLKPCWESISPIALLNAASEGLGVAIIPLSTLDAYPNCNIRIIDIDLNISHQINIVYSSAKMLNTPALEFIEFCKQASLL